MTDLTARIKSALRAELGGFTSPAKLEAAARAVIEAMKPEIQGIMVHQTPIHLDPSGHRKGFAIWSGEG